MFVSSIVSHVKLYGTKGERFEAIKADLQDELGYEPTNPEVVGILMARYGAGADDSGASLASVSRSTARTASQTD